MAMVMLGCLALANIWTSTPAWALNADELLDLMVSEKAITPEKAEKIKQKARKIDRVKKAEEEAKRARELEQVKQEAKAEAKAEAKTEAAKEVALAEKRVEKKASRWIPENLPEPLKGLKVGVLAYLHYNVGNSPRAADGHVSLNQFSIERGYLNITKKITPWLYARYTPDLTQDSTGDWKLRQKYLYADLLPPNAGKVLTQIHGEIGLSHTPWQDFEESIMPYRSQGTVAIERATNLPSADLGVNIRGNFGGKLADAKHVIGQDHYDGRYGSWQLGVYNGTGYHAFENNDNKTVEYRLTLRPLPDFLPGFQATYNGLYGKSNSSSASNFGGPFLQFFPDWIVHQGFLSYQNPWVILTAQTWASKGNQAGTWTTTPGIPGMPIGRRADSLWTQGYSVFGDVKVPVTLSIPFWKGGPRYPLHAFIRTDWFNADPQHVIVKSGKYTKLITGVAYHLYKNNLILLSYERTWYGRDYGTATGFNGSNNRVVSPALNGTNLGTDNRFTTVFQISY
ncbi:MAG: hypothetical protein M1438_04750 [Deltaproteobacteria bacterium]|nr:hypothetical protein [Deltaproteobacteria bacterium]